MAMEVDNRQQSQLNSLGYDPLRYGAPQFTNPWAAAAAAVSAAPSSQMAYSSAMTTAPTQQVARPTSISIPYNALPVTAPSLGADLLNPARGYGSQYPATATLPQYSMDYNNSNRSPYSYAQDSARRSSHPLSTQQRNSFSDALDASQGMVSLSQADITPRNIYGNQGSSRSSSDSYGFPATHSAHSSISSASYNPSYYNGSVADSSVTDYSSASESVDLNSRTLPRPPSLIGDGLPPAPQSMMGQFSSKVSSSSQKKHKCKICDKRFTRPSSLQTHMYSHTGEKPFACEVEGCGRHFSVVSNLRRHRKVHKSDRDHPSPDDS